MERNTRMDLLWEYYRDKRELTIENGVLVKYVGDDRQIIVPDGVAAILLEYSQTLSNVFALD